MSKFVKHAEKGIYRIANAWLEINSKPDLKMLTEFLLEQLLGLLF